MDYIKECSPEDIPEIEYDWDFEKLILEELVERFDYE